ncbi:glycosyltransferase [Pseudoduganella sp. LjRoot289]|uniref:glycosyltransferase n=1 Tax=Pseudoduganella sp. LjRoot289 TaxID=3342314 RepID=UPI003ECFEA9E
MVNKRVLMIAYHYPPMRGSSGIQRTLKFSQYLPQCGWAPVVLSAHPRAYSNPGPDQMGDIPASVPVTRAFALDTARHLSFKGRYAGFMALPDRWVSWCLGAIPAGLRLIRRHRPAVIWSTYPIASAHLVGLALKRLTGLPWVADLRDPMTDVSYPEDPLTRKVYQWIERQTVKHCTVAVCTTPGAIVTYHTRFPEIPRERFRLIENAYDEENFTEAERELAQQPPAPPAADAPLTLVHSGVIYPSERDPVPLFQALAALQQQGAISGGTLRIVLRATGHDDYLAGLIREHGIGSIVQLAPHVPYRTALTEMLSADGLLILQATNCNHQVPAKLYEYLRARRPILALTDAEGDTAATLRGAGIDTIAPLDGRDAIIAALPRFLEQVRGGNAPLASAATIAAHSRRARSEQLAQLLDLVAAAEVATPVASALTK